MEETIKEGELVSVAMMTIRKDGVEIFKEYRVPVEKNEKALEFTFTTMLDEFENFERHFRGCYKYKDESDGYVEIEGLKCWMALYANDKDLLKTPDCDGVVLQLKPFWKVNEGYKSKTC